MTRQGGRASSGEQSEPVGQAIRSGRPWSFKTVTDTLLNPANIGTVAFRDVLAEDAHPPIINREVFALADQILTERGENPAKAAGVASGYHLTGKINCPLCGKAYLGMTATGRNRTYRYHTCFTRNRYGTDHCNAPRIEAEAFDDIVLAAVGDFYRTRTDLITQGRSPPRKTTTAPRRPSKPNWAPSPAKWPRKRPPSTGTSPTTKQARSTKLSSKPASRKSALNFEHSAATATSCTYASTTSPSTSPAWTALNDYIGEVIDHGTAAVRKSLCEAAIHELRIDLNASKATPVYRVNLAVAEDPPNDESAPAGTPAGAHSRSSFCCS